MWYVTWRDQFSCPFDSLKNGIPAAVTGILSGLLIVQNLNVVTGG